MALALLGPAPGASAAVEKSLWEKVPGRPRRVPRRAKPLLGLSLYRQLGVDVYQFQLPWSNVAKTRPQNPRNPNDPAYTWPAFADFVAPTGGRNGIQLATMVKSTPPWANGGQGVTTAPNNHQTTPTSCSRPAGALQHPPLDDLGRAQLRLQLPADA